MQNADGRRRAPASARTPRARTPHAVADLRHPVYLVGPDARMPARAAAPLRPWGYLAMTVLWAALDVIAWVIAFIGLAVPLLSPLGAQPGLQRMGVGGGIVLLVVAGSLVGTVGVILACGVTGLLLLNATFFVRSLRASYRGERLSISVHSVGAEAFGAASVAGFGTAFSAIPVRLTRGTKILTVVTSLGFVWNAEVWAVGVPWGLCTAFTGAWIAWPVQGAAAVGVCAAISAVLLLFTAGVVWRRRHAYPNVMPAALRGTAYEWSWPNRTV